MMEAGREILVVTGASRSGTTMLSRALGRNSDVLSLNELHYFGDLFTPGGQNPRRQRAEAEALAAGIVARQARGIWNGSPNESDRDVGRRIVEGMNAETYDAFEIYAACLKHFAAAAGKTVACEQTPRNIFYAEAILEALPQARVVHIVRDPRAVLASQKYRWQLRRLGAGNVPLSELVRTWVNYHPFTMTRLWCSATRAALNLKEHPRFCIVRFEDLAADPETTLTSLCRFLGLDMQPDMLRVPQWGSSIVRHGRQDGISGESSTKWMQLVSGGERMIVERTGKDLMKKFDYLPTAGARHWVGALPYLFTYPLHLAGVLLANPRRAWILFKATLKSGTPTR